MLISLLYRLLLVLFMTLMPLTIFAEDPKSIVPPQSDEVLEIDTTGGTEGTFADFER